MSKLTIAIPTYNYEKYLAEAIESALEQCAKDVIVHVVDDGSTDKTPEVVKQYLSDQRVRYTHHEKNWGMVANWNHCIELCSTPFLVILHADDMLLPRFAEKGLKVMEEFPRCGMVFSACEEIIAWKRKRSAVFPFLQSQRFQPRELAFELLARGNFIRFPTVLLRHPNQMDVGVFDSALTLTVDLEMWMRINWQWEAYYLAEPLAVYRVHGQNASLKFIRDGTELYEIRRAFQCFAKRCGLNAFEFKEGERRLQQMVRRKILSPRYLVFLLQEGGWKAVNRSLCAAKEICPGVAKHSFFLFLYWFTQMVHHRKAAARDARSPHPGGIR